MFDIGWTEMLVIAIVMIVVVGPKDLPKMLRTFGKTTAKMRAMAGDFQRQFNEALKEAELDDVKKSVDELRSLNPANEIKKQLNPFEKAAADVRAGLDSLKSPAAKPAAPATPAATTDANAQPAIAADAAAQSAEPASPVVHAAEPLKNGATAISGVAGPETMPAAPVMAPLANGAAAKQGAVSPQEVTKPAAKSSAKAANGKAAPKAASKSKPSGAAKAAAPKVKATAKAAATKKAAEKPAAKKTKANAS